MVFYIIKLCLLLLLIRKPTGFFSHTFSASVERILYFFILRSINTLDYIFEFPNIEIILVLLE